MTTVARPPVNEVVISISLREQPVLEGPRLVVALGPIMAEFPQADQVVPYEMTIEQPFEEQVVQPAAPQIQFLKMPHLKPRYWLTQSDSSSLLLQVQPNYFALNWRRHESDAYPGFDQLRRHFQAYLARFEEGVISQGGEPLSATQIELTYINILRPNELWGNTKDLGKVVRLRIPGIERFEQLNVAYSEAVTTESGDFYGRLHAAVSTGYQPKSEPVEFRPLRAVDLVPVINLSITTRTSSIHENASSVGGRFDLAHEAVTRTFKNLTTREAQASWGLL